MKLEYDLISVPSNQGSRKWFWFVVSSAISLL